MQKNQVTEEGGRERHSCPGGYKCVCVFSRSVVSDFCDPMDLTFPYGARQTPLSMDFSRQKYWSGMSFPSPGDFHDPGIESRSPTLKADSLMSESPRKPS